MQIRFYWPVCVKRTCELSHYNTVYTPAYIKGPQHIHTITDKARTEGYAGESWVVPFCRLLYRTHQISMPWSGSRSIGLHIGIESIHSCVLCRCLQHGWPAGGHDTSITSIGRNYLHTIYNLVQYNTVKSYSIAVNDIENKRCIII